MNLFIFSHVVVFRGSYFIKAVENFFPVFDFVSGLHNCLEFSQPLSCLYQAMQTRKTFSIAVYNGYLFFVNNYAIQLTGCSVFIVNKLSIVFSNLVSFSDLE